MSRSVVTLFSFMISDLRLLAACGFLIALVISGCGGNGLTEISGTVTHGGWPIQKGTITFLPPHGDGPTAAAIIKDGTYAVRVAPGLKQVKIDGFKVLGQRRYIPNDPASPMVDVLEQMLPARYNSKTELVCDIASRACRRDFALER